MQDEPKKKQEDPKRWKSERDPCFTKFQEYEATQR